MIKRAIQLAVLAAFSASSLTAVAADGDAILGEWLTGGGSSKVEVYKKDDKYFGKIVWLKEPNIEAGQPNAGSPKVDSKNPEEARRKDPIVGLELLRDFVYDGTAAWTKGTIYDPESGKTYSCTIKINDEGKLDVRGYIGVPAFGRSTVWTRAPKDAAATDGAAADAPAAKPGSSSKDKKAAE